MVEPIGSFSGGQYPIESHAQIQSLFEKALNAYQDQLETAKNKADWQTMASWVLENDPSTKGIAKNNPFLVTAFIDEKSDSIFAEKSPSISARRHKSHRHKPIHVQSPVETKATTSANKSWVDYKKSFIQEWTVGGVTYDRVLQPDYPGETTSEGMGYALRMAVQNGDQATFDKLLAFINKNLDGNGLMNWHVNQTGPLGTGGATDADQDIAYALCQAAEK